MKESCGKTYSRYAISIVIMVVLIVSLMYTSAAIACGAEKSQLPTITVKTVEGSAGQDVAVTVVMKNNPGITSLDFSVTYDKEWLTLLSQENGTLLGGQMNSQSFEEIPYYCGWFNAFQVNNCTKDGILLTLHFHVKENAPDGFYSVTITEKEVIGYNAKLTEKRFQTYTGGIRTKSAANGNTNTTTDSSAGKNPDSSTDKKTGSTIVEKVKTTKVTITSATWQKTKKRIKLTYKATGKAKLDGYQIWRSVRRNNGYKKVFTTTSKSYSDYKLAKKKTTYYYKIRGYRKTGKKTYYTQWSEKMKITAGRKKA